jgi:hypothetical protein
VSWLTEKFSSMVNNAEEIKSRMAAGLDEKQEAQRDQDPG